jgi:hypothetical protein
MFFLRKTTPKKEILPPNLVAVSEALLREHCAFVIVSSARTFVDTSPQVLPHDAPSWYKQSSLLRLNLILLVPLLSSATIGFDG